MSARAKSATAVARSTRPMRRRTITAAPQTSISTIRLITNDPATAHAAARPKTTFPPSVCDERVEVVRVLEPDGDAR